MQLYEQAFGPDPTLPQPVPIWHAAPWAQAGAGIGGGGGGGGVGGDGGGQVTLHWKCPEPSQKHELEHPLGIPLPQPEFPLHGAPGVTQVPVAGCAPGGQISVTHLPLMMA